MTLRRAKRSAERSQVGSSIQPRHIDELRAEYLRCPICAEPMIRKHFGRRSGVFVDECARHGTWFDRGELKRVVAFIESGAMPPAPSPPEQRLPKPSWPWGESRTKKEEGGPQASETVALLIELLEEVE